MTSEATCTCACHGVRLEAVCGRRRAMLGLACDWRPNAAAAALCSGFPLAERAMVSAGRRGCWRHSPTCLSHPFRPLQVQTRALTSTGLARQRTAACLTQRARASSSPASRAPARLRPPSASCSTSRTAACAAWAVPCLTEASLTLPWLWAVLSTRLGSGARSRAALRSWHEFDACR